LKSSELSGFYKLTPEKRLAVIRDLAKLTDEEVTLLETMKGLSIDQANRMAENVIGCMPLPLGLAVNFIVNGRDYVVPMATEEPSVIAAASNAAKMARVTGGFRASSMGSVMIGQIQMVNLPDMEKAKSSIIASKDKLLKIANEMDPILTSMGGGAKDLRLKPLRTVRGPMLVVELLVDCKDAMGANVVNTMCEVLAPVLEDMVQGSARLRILSNLATERLARSEVIMRKDELGEAVIEGMLDAYALALADPHRAVTHNKGIMNGITAVLTATGNDTRAVEAGAHSYAALGGRYRPLTTWEKTADGNLIGRIELPLAVGVIGGATHHPIAKISLKILGVKSASEFSCILVSVGLAQNFAALKALVSEGIQRGHMKLHARNIAMTAGATGEMIDAVAERLISEKKIRLDRARELLEALTKT